MLRNNREDLSAQSACSFMVQYLFTALLIVTLRGPLPGLSKKRLDMAGRSYLIHRRLMLVNHDLERNDFMASCRSVKSNKRELSE